MANMQTKIVLVGASQSEVSALLAGFVVVGNDNTVIINPTAPNEVTLDSWNNDVLKALAHMSDAPNGIAGEYFTKLGGDTANFTAQKIYLAVDSIDQPNSLVRNDGKKGRAKGTETGTTYFRKSTVAEIIKQLGDKPADTTVQFTVSGQADEINVLARLAGVTVKGDVTKAMAMTNGGLVSAEAQADVHYQLLEQWDEALQALRDFKPSNNLPQINGYAGVIEGDFVVYDCAKLPISWFKPVEGATRRIKSLELTSEVVINADDFEAIAQVVAQLA